MKKDLRDLMMVRDALLMMQGKMLYKRDGVHELLDGTAITFVEISKRVAEITKECEGCSEYADFIDRVRDVHNHNWYQGGAK